MEEEIQGEHEQLIPNEGDNGESKAKQPLSAAQKKRQKLQLKKKLAKEAAETGGNGDTVEPGDGQEPKSSSTGDADGKTKKKLQDKATADDKGKKEHNNPKQEKTKGPSKAQIAAIQAAIQAAKDEEERLLKEEEEKDRLQEEAEEARQLKLKLEQERKERKKQKEKERKARLKEEGKLLTPKQRQEKLRAQQMLEALKAQGTPIPEATGSVAPEKKTRLGTRARRPKKIQNQNTEENANYEAGSESDLQNQLGALSIEENEEEEKKIKEAWDESDGEREDSTRSSNSKSRNDGEGSDDDDDEDSSASSKTESKASATAAASKDANNNGNNDISNRLPTPPIPRRVKEEPSIRIEKRRLENEKSRSLDILRSPVVCVLGHVDTGKTKILDKLRRTNVQDGEAGGITQQIGATNVPIEAIKESARFVKAFTEFDVKVPGLLIIDTPGHESFSNLRSRGSSLCDIAILVVDIMHGLEPQTIESLNLLRKKKTPFVVALNKIDRIYDWQANAKRDVRDGIKSQSKNSLQEFQKRSNEVIVQFAEEGLNAALFYENPDPKEYISMVPTSALTGEGMGNLMALIVEYSQKMLQKRLMYSNELQATVLEVKAIPGLGTTIDVILINGKLREGEQLILAGTDGPIVTQIRSLLTPQPMKELRVKNTYIEYKEIRGAIGVKIAGKDLETAIAGLNILVAYSADEVECCKEEVARELKTVLSSFRLQERGVYVQASTLGSLEALLEFLRSSSIPYSGIKIGPVVKKDVMKASVMLEHGDDSQQFAVILAFDVKIERDAQDLADNLGLKIFQADIIYHLFDKFIAYRDELKKKKREEFKTIAVFPTKLKILPQFIFNSRDPIVVGVSIEAGTLKIGTPICVPAKEFLEIGRVTSIEINHKQVDKAVKGQDVCVKIEPISGESPKMLGRHFEMEDLLVSKITRESIDACKEYFRTDLQKSDWQLMVELKKMFQIM